MQQPALEKLRRKKFLNKLLLLIDRYAAKGYKVIPLITRGGGVGIQVLCTFFGSGELFRNMTRDGGELLFTVYRAASCAKLKFSIIKRYINLNERKSSHEIKS